MFETSIQPCTRETQFVCAIYKVDLHARTLPQQAIGLRRAEQGTNSGRKISARGRLGDCDAELGLSLYAPTPTTHRYRLDYTDPFTDKRCQPRRVDQGDAFALWDETLEYLQTARHAMPLSSKDRKSNVPTVNG